MAGVAQLAEASAQVLAGKPRRVSPYFVPSVLNNMAAGALSCKLVKPPLYSSYAILPVVLRLALSSAACACLLTIERSSESRFFFLLFFIF